jgi:hypothetical protein
MGSDPSTGSPQRLTRQLRSGALPDDTFVPFAHFVRQIAFKQLCPVASKSRWMAQIDLLLSRDSVMTANGNLNFG